MLLTRNDPGDQKAATTLATEVSDRYRDLGLRRHAESATALLDPDATG
jgi:hypothetical protein